MPQMKFADSRVCFCRAFLSLRGDPCAASDSSSFWWCVARLARRRISRPPTPAADYPTEVSALTLGPAADYPTEASALTLGPATAAPPMQGLGTEALAAQRTTNSASS